jgi:hypothetical protein
VIVQSPTREALAPSEDAGWLDDLADDSDALDAWEYAFAEVLDTTLEAADDSDPVVADDLDLEGHGPALVTRLFLSRRDGVRITELAGALKDAATAGLAAEEAGRQWQEWVDAHGDPCAFSWASSKGSVPSASPTTQCGWSRSACTPSARSWSGTPSARTCLPNSNPSERTSHG